MQAAVDQLLERDLIVLGNGRETDVKLILVVLGAEIECRARLRHRAQPVLCGHMSNILHQFDDALAGAAFAGEYARLLQWHAVPDRHSGRGPERDPMRTY